MAFFCNGKKGICEYDKKNRDCGCCGYVDGSGGYEIPDAPKLLQTHADRIRAMSDEELAKILIYWEDDWGRWQTDAGCVYDDCHDHYEKAIKAELDWLRQPVKDGEDDG